MFLRSVVGQCPYPPAAYNCPFFHRTALDTQQAPLQEMAENGALLDSASTGLKELVVQSKTQLSPQLPIQ